MTGTDDCRLLRRYEGARSLLEREEGMNTIQFFLTPAAGKQLIADALSAREDIKAALREHTVVIVAGSTNGYVAESLLQSIGQAEDFCRSAFYRGLLKPATAKASRPAYGSDIVIRHGEWIREQMKWIAGTPAFEI